MSMHTNTAAGRGVGARLGDDTHLLPSAVEAAEKHVKRSRLRRVMSHTPYFVYTLIFYVILKLSVDDIRAEAFAIGPYQLRWVEGIYFVAFALGMMELLHVAEPGVDNTSTALRIAGAGVVYLVLFVLATVDVPLLSVLKNTEALVLLLLVLIQVPMAFILNSRTLKRAIENYEGVDRA